MNAILLACLAALTAVSSAPQAEVRNVRIRSPKLLVSREKAGSDVKIAGQFKVEMSFARASAKQPVIRLVCLGEVNGALLMNGILLDRPNTVEPMRRADVQSALKASGVEVPAKEREQFCTDPAKFTPYLQEVSRTAYASAIYGDSDLKRGFFRLGRSETLPKLLIYRIEVWQNGVMVASHESTRNGLGTYALPADWYEWKKYPQKFRYAGLR